MEIAGVDKWEKMVGKPIRVMTENGLTKKIGHFLKNDWFCPSEDIKRKED
jgi:hypothetical protein